MRESLAHRRLRAPQGQLESLAVPPLSEAAEQLQENLRQRSAPWRLDLDRGELQRSARREAMELALRHTRTYRDVESPSQDAPWILAGHQPQLFHPGVWMKNFALSQLGQHCRAVAMNLIVDNDLCTAASIRVPCPDGERWRYETVDWDRASDSVPFEERAVLDGERFSSFADRVRQAVAPLISQPLVSGIWPTATRRQLAGEPAGICLAAGRHHLEGDLGLQTLEAPLSEIFQLPSACRWVAAVLGQLPQLSRVYNEMLSRYRWLNRVRSRAHPVPDLESDDPWFEAPFWWWTRENPRRRRLFVRHQRGRWTLSDRQWSEQTDRLAEWIGELPQRGFRLRPRALMTTLFARTVLGDLFLHGIGGAKYDQLTDAIMSAGLGIEPPGFLTLTATVQLSPRLIGARRHRITALRRLVRDLKYNPQRHLRLSPQDAGRGEAERLVEEKRRWVDQRHDLARRHRALADVNRRLQSWVEPQRQQALQELDRELAELQDDLKLANREHSFCLYDQQELPAQLLDLCRIPE